MGRCIRVGAGPRLPRPARGVPTDSASVWRKRSGAPIKGPSGPSSVFAEAKAKVALPAETVWNRLSDLRALSQWAPDVAGSPAEGLRPGATRWARLYKPVYGKDVLIERITDVDPVRRAFTYQIEGGIGPLTSIETTWRVSPDRGAGSIVIVSSILTVTGLARFLPVLVLKQWTARLQALVDGFARWAEDLEGDAEVMDDTFPLPPPAEPEVSVELVEAPARAEEPLPAPPARARAKGKARPARKAAKARSR